MTSGVLLSTALLTAFLANPTTPLSRQPCVAEAVPTAEQKARRMEGVQLARTVHNLQMNQPGARAKKYMPQPELALQIPAGWEVKLDVTPAGYWFMVTDKNDPCGRSFVSNQDGVIFQAQPLR